MIVSNTKPKPKFNYENKEKPNLSIGILLAAGNSTRFKEPRFSGSTPSFKRTGTGTDVPKIYKQLYLLERYNTKKYLFQYSLDAIIPNVDVMLIITNSKCFKQIQTIIKKSYPDNCELLCINSNDRLESIQLGLSYIRTYIEHEKYRTHVLIHDSARPFVPSNVFGNLIQYNIKNSCVYSQCVLKLVNGLIHKTKTGNHFVNRDHYIEACTPLCIDFDVADFIYKNYMKNKEINEFLPIVIKYKLPCHFIEESFYNLRKITTIDDLYLI